MAAYVQGSPAHHHDHLQQVPATVSPLDYLYHEHHLPSPHLLQNPYQHYQHRQYLLPPPFLCTRCKCWNFPAKPNLNHHHVYHRHPLPHFQPFPHHHHHHHHPHPHPLPLPESTEGLQAQEPSDVNGTSTTSHAIYQGENIFSDRCDGPETGDDEEEYEFVMTDEWMEFFAKSEARRQEKKRQQKKAARDLRKATRVRLQTQDPSQRVDE